MQTLTVALAISALVHHAILGDWRIRTIDSVVVVFAIVGVLHPTPAALVALLCGTLLLAIDGYPDISNHLVLTAALAFGVLFSLATSATTGGRLVRSPHRLWLVVAPCARTALLITYGFAALAKLNRSFFEPAGSCAVTIYRELSESIWFLPDGTEWHRVVTWLVVAVEVALPVLIAWRRTRLVGLAIGTAFHLGLVVAGHGAFSTAALALYVAFLPEAVFDRGFALSRFVWWQSIFRGLRRIVTSIQFIVVALAIWIVLHRWTVPDGTGREVTRLAGTAKPLTIGLILGASALAIVALKTRGPERPRPRARRTPQPGWFALIVVLSVMGASPYVGLKTTSSFTMYSNLRTEDGEWNHVLVPEQVQVFDFQERSVSIVATEDPQLAEYLTSGDRLVWYDFAEHRRSHHDKRVLIDVEGRRVELAAGDPFGPFDEPHTALDKLLAFRPLPRENRCLH